MKDTHESVQARFEMMLMQRTPEERLEMGCSMFDAAKEMARASILKQNPEISLENLKKEIFLRFYGEDFNQAQIGNILKSLF